MVSLSSSLLLSLLLASVSVFSASAWVANSPVLSRAAVVSSTSRRTPTSPASRLPALKTKEEEATAAAPKSAEEATEKYGLEVGLFQSLKQKDGESAKSLLKKYGIAYLATSIPLAIMSFALCYVLVDSGVDVAGLLAKVGIETNDASEKAGTAAIAYAAHKAASPIRFPPTVLLTPVVAKFIGKEPAELEEDDGAAAVQE